MIWPFVMRRGEGGAIKWWNVGVCLLLIEWCEIERKTLNMNSGGD